jgi:hypothetical protein
MKTTTKITRKDARVLIRGLGINEKRVFIAVLKKRNEATRERTGAALSNKESTNPLIEQTMMHSAIIAKKMKSSIVNVILSNHPI